MSGCAIRAEALGKCFQRSGRGRRGLHEVVESLVRAPLRALRSARSADGAGFWALRDVSFEVRSGEVVGVLGANGAGKSVLLKLLARVTAPTEGRAELWGHVGALLEIGAGFHPELSGRSNVYFNGAILGMSREEIRRKFDQIVSFSETESVIDVPVKLYSSGMRMRLAFAVATHLEPDILLIDEALGVGDAAFRQKARETIARFVANGHTILLVSHDAGVIADLCSRAIWLEGGRLIADGATADLLARYADRAAHR